MGDSCDEGDGMIFDDEECEDPAAEKPAAKPAAESVTVPLADRRLPFAGLRPGPRNSDSQNEAQPSPRRAADTGGLRAPRTRAAPPR